MTCSLFSGNDDLRIVMQIHLVSFELYCSLNTNSDSLNLITVPALFFKLY